MKVAVAYKDGEIFEHFGHCEMFAIYDYYGDSVEDCTKQLLECADKHGHNDMVELMKQHEIAAVICGSMGDEARSLLLSSGIVPVAGYTGDADTAADMLVTGQLPVTQGGGCSGGCGGCGGADGEEGCGCGGGCSGCG